MLSLVRTADSLPGQRKTSLLGMPSEGFQEQPPQIPGLFVWPAVPPVLMGPETTTALIHLAVLLHEKILHLHRSNCDLGASKTYLRFASDVGEPMKTC